MNKPAKSASNNDSGSHRRATSYDVAELAGVSQSAVSRVFQQGASASKEMRDRVLTAANKLGYRPNAIARGLITQRSNMVAVVISQQTNLYYPEFLVQLTQRFSEHGIRVLLFALEHEGDIDQMLEQVLQYRVDGLVTAAMLSPQQFRTIENAGIPVILYNRTVPDTLANSVRCDQAEGERWLVSELFDAGHRRFAIVTGPEDSPVSTERTRGALQRLDELGIRDVKLVRGDYSSASGRAAFAEIMRELGEPPDAVVAANDAMAIGCIDSARVAFGLEVPGDVSVVGFDGVGPARFAAYDVTTVRQPVGRMTEAAVAMLIDRIGNTSLSAEQRVFSGERIRGGSARFLDTSDQ
ncbi:MAG: LacI family DNA-binding transcriptional regulator [Pseudomonadota bacterium]